MAAKATAQCLDLVRNHCPTTTCYWHSTALRSCARDSTRNARTGGGWRRRRSVFYMVKDDAANVLRCRHGHTTNTLATQARKRRSHAASLVAAAVLGPCVVRKALGGVAGVAGAEATAMGYGTRRALVRMLLALYEAREAKRARRSASLPCGCSAVHVSACEGAHSQGAVAISLIYATVHLHNVLINSNNDRCMWTCRLLLHNAS